MFMGQNVSGENVSGTVKTLRDIDTSQGHKTSQTHRNIDHGGASKRDMD